MSLLKLRVELQEILPEKGISELNDFQSSIIDGLKSGKNLLIEGHEGAGKTTAILLSLLQKITEAGEGSPRAIVICSTDEKAYSLHAALEKICRLLDLTVDLAHDRGNKLQQRNDIFDGTEIIVGTPKRLQELYIQNGYNVSKLKLFVLDDAIELFKGGYKTQISRIAESLPKCQYLMASQSFSDKRIEEFLDLFVPVSLHIEAE
jgi:superfamily II DNA/RNA helicase